MPVGALTGEIVSNSLISSVAAPTQALESRSTSDKTLNEREFETPLIFLSCNLIKAWFCPVLESLLLHFESLLKLYD